MRYLRPSAYLWARCEGWAKIGVYHAVIVDDERGVVCDESGKVLLRRETNGMWIEPGKESGGMSFDRIAVTHLPVNPEAMSKDGWQEKLAEREANRVRLKQEAFERFQQKKRHPTPKMAKDVAEAENDLFGLKPDDIERR